MHSVGSAYIKVQNSGDTLGHYSVAFTLDQYGHSTSTMKKQSSEAMEAYIQEIKKQ